MDFKTNKSLEFTGYPVFNKSTFKREPVNCYIP